MCPTDGHPSIGHPEVATNAMISEPSAKAERARVTMKSSLAQVWA